MAFDNPAIVFCRLICEYINAFCVLSAFSGSWAMFLLFKLELLYV